MQNIFIFYKIGRFKTLPNQGLPNRIGDPRLKHLLSRQRFLQGLDIKFISFLFHILTLKWSTHVADKG